MHDHALNLLFKINNSNNPSLDYSYLPKNILFLDKFYTLNVSCS